MKARSKKRPTPTQNQPKTILSLADKCKLIGIPLGIFVAVIWISIFAHTRRQSRSIDQIIERWSKRYDLTGNQAEQLREIELSFHGNGNPFIFSNPPTREEVREHHIRMSKVVNQDMAERFFEDLEKGQKRH